MLKPFQFSMGRMFALVTLFCVDLGVYFAMQKTLPERERHFDVFIMVVAVCTVVVGLALRRPLAGFLWGLTVAALLSILVAIVPSK
jgi:undecaprenyl pyrophosphate phosphatase UppP